jgi:hypothetical protein
MYVFLLLFPLIGPRSSERLWSSRKASELTVKKLVVGNPGSIEVLFDFA